MEFCTCRGGTVAGLRQLNLRVSFYLREKKMKCVPSLDSSLEGIQLDLSR